MLNIYKYLNSKYIDIDIYFNIHYFELIYMKSE